MSDRSVMSLVRPIRGGQSRPRHSTARVGTRDAATIELRFVHTDDAAAVRRLAELDSSPQLTGQVMVALLNGEPVAGLSLLDRRVVANPFVATEEAVALLRLRAEHLSATPTHRALRRVRRPGAASAPADCRQVVV